MACVLTYTTTHLRNFGYLRQLLREIFFVNQMNMENREYILILLNDNSAKTIQWR